MISSQTAAKFLSALPFWISFLLIPVLWERPGNIKPLVRLIQAYIRIGAAQVIFF